MRPKWKSVRAEQILDFASASDRRWDCSGTLVILTSDDKQWNRAAQRFPKPARDTIELQQLAVLCRDTRAVARKLLDYQPVGDLVVAMFSDQCWHFIAEFHHIDEAAKKGLVSLAHYLIDPTAGDIGAAAASISRGVSVLIKNSLSIEQFTYAAKEPSVVVAGIFKGMEEWNSVRLPRAELAANGMALLGHVGASEAYRQAELAHLASVITDGIYRPFAPKSDLVFVGLRGGECVDLITKEYEINPDYDHFDPAMVRNVRGWRHDTFGQLCKYAQIYEDEVFNFVMRYEDPEEDCNPREAARRLRAAINRGRIPELKLPKPGRTPEEDLRHGIQNLIQKIAEGRTFSASAGA